MLYTRFTEPAGGVPSRGTLVLIHGLLGNTRDWEAVANELKDYAVLTVDLPGHGGSSSISCDGFDDCCRLVLSAILNGIPPRYLTGPVFLIGYSLGARIIMYGLSYHGFDALDLGGCILEGGNTGLQSQAEIQQRLMGDRLWAARFEHEPIEQVLVDWYCQSVFSSLTPEQRTYLVQKRSHNDGRGVSRMLMATSLAKQPYLLDSLKRSYIPLHYLCGEKDQKFSELAEQSGLSFTRAKHAGHNVHSEQPHVFAQLVRTIITEIQTRQLE